MAVFAETFTNLFADGEVSGSSPDAQGDFYLLTDAQADHEYLQEKIADAISALSTVPTGDFLIIYGGVVSDGGSGTVNISECLCKTKDTNGKKRLVYIPALTGIALPSGWNDGRSIWVTARYDFKLGTLTRTHKLGGSYHYQIADTYMGDSAGYISTGTADLFTTSDPVATATILGKFTMTSTTFADLGVRSPVLDLNSGDTAVTATAAGTTTLTVASKPVQHFTGTTTQSVVLPVAASMGLIGKRFRIANRSTGVVTVYASNGSNVVKALEAGEDAEFVCIALSGVTATSWMVKNYVNTNGAQTIAGVKTFSSIPAGPASNPTTDNQLVRKKYCDDTFVDLTSSETVAGVKTFSSIPVGPASDPTTDNQLTRRKFITDNSVFLTGDQTVAGVKTFSSIPVLPASDPTTDNQAVRYSYIKYAMKYDYVVDSQTAFNTLVASGTWLGAKNVLFTADVTRTAQTTIPATVQKIHAINGATLTVTGLTVSNQYGLGYASMPSDPKFEVKGLKVSATSTNHVFGFYNCINLSNCYGMGETTTSGYSGIGFESCSRLTNCSGTGTGSNDSMGYGFSNCNQLIHCIGEGTGTHGTSAGFANCTRLTGCTGIGTGIGTGGEYGMGFSACVTVTACYGRGVKSGSGGGGYGFYSCNKCINNSPYAGSTTATYNTSYADSGTSNACSDTAAGGYNNS